MAAARRIPEGDRLRARRPLADVGTDAAAGRRRPRRDARDRRVRAHRPRDGAPRPRLRDADPVPRRRIPADARGGGASSARAASRWTSSCASPTSSRLHVNLTDETHHLIDAAALRAHEADGGARQHVPRPGRRPGGARATRCATARSSPPASTSPSPEPLPADHPLVQAAELPRRAAHRVGVAGDARQDGRDGRGEPAGRAARRAPAEPDQPRGLRNLVVCACGRAAEPARSSRGRGRPGSRRSGGSRTTGCRTMALPDSECPRG